MKPVSMFAESQAAAAYAVHREERKKEHVYLTKWKEEGVGGGTPQKRWRNANNF